MCKLPKKLLEKKPTLFGIASVNILVDFYNFSNNTYYNHEYNELRNSSYKFETSLYTMFFVHKSFDFTSTFVVVIETPLDRATYS